MREPAIDVHVLSRLLTIVGSRNLQFVLDLGISAITAAREELLSHLPIAMSAVESITKDAGSSSKDTNKILESPRVVSRP